MSRRFVAAAAACLIASAATGSAQEHQHQHESDQPSSPWMLMGDGTIFGLFNHQGGPRGGDEFKAPNWWMGMASRRAGGGRLTLTGMLSLDPLTAGEAGYREIFQVGEALDGRPLTVPVVQVPPPPQTPLAQSELKSQRRPLPHAAQEQPQSMSLSFPSSTPSAQGLVVVTVTGQPEHSTTIHASLIM